MLKKNVIMLLTSISIIGLNIAKAETTNSNTWFPHTARILGSGAAASDVRTIGGDGMLPVYGNQEGFAFVDFMGDYGSDNTYLVSPGLGYRKVISNQIAGAYFFGDYERTSLGTNFWVMSPGVEWMNVNWDAHLNGYFPTETSKQSGEVAFLNTFGDYSQVSFETGTHNQYDELVAPFAVIGNGVDAEIGYSFAELGGLRSRVYLGGYYYAPPSSDNVDNITGVTAGFEQPLSKNIKLSIFNSYDQVNDYAVGVSLTATFGQESTVFSNNIQDRLLDPVQRHVGIINTGAGTYDQQDLQSSGYGLEYDNIYFISPDGTGNGTYGNPAPLTQTTLDTINNESPDDARLYIQGGDNADYYINGTTATKTDGLDIYSDLGLYVYNGQDLYGRTADYKAPADANAQPQILVDAENSYNAFISFNTEENTFSDLTISKYTETNNGSYAFIGINTDYDDPSDKVVWTYNRVNVTGLTGSASSTGVAIENRASADLTINIRDSVLNNAYNGAFFLNADDGKLTANVKNSNLSNNGYDGIYAENDATGDLTINIKRSTINDNDYSGIFAYNFGSGSVAVNAKNSNFSGNTFSGVAGNISNTADNGSLIFNLSKVTADNNGFYGVYATNDNANGGSFTVNSEKSTLNDNGQYGIFSTGTDGGTTTVNYVANFMQNNGTDSTNEASSSFVTWNH